MGYLIDRFSNLKSKGSLVPSTSCTCFKPLGITLYLHQHDVLSSDDSLAYHDGQPFSTSGCGARYHGGWWYADCHRVLLSGPYGQLVYDTSGVTWYHRKTYTLLTYMDMKIKPIGN